MMNAKRATLDTGPAETVPETAKQEAWLEGRGLTKRFGGRAVVDNVEIRIRPGEVVGFLGPNGAGKTTTFYMLVGLLKPDAGRILLRGEDITTLPLYRRARRGISYLPQEPSVFRKLTVEENLLAVLETLPLNEAERHARLQSLLDELGIAKLAKVKAGVLSGGERRRVEITRALVLDPIYLCLDEPFAGIDPITVIEIQRVIKYLKMRGIGVLMSDHNVQETLSITESRLCDSRRQNPAEREFARDCRERSGARGLPRRSLQAALGT